MAWVFNPFTAKLDFAGSGGGGSSYIDGEVQYYSNLPILVNNPPIDSAFIVREASGAWLINRKPAGIYVRLANAGALTDWTYAGTFPDVFSDANFTVYDNADSSRTVQFNLNGVSPSTNQTLSIPNRSGTVVVSDITAGTGSDVVNNIVSLTQAEYNAIVSPDTATLYLITDP
jgi:hypothetical protein